MTDDRSDGAGEPVPIQRRGPDEVDGHRDTLACGASVDELLSQVADGRAGERTMHQRDCVHCRAALAEYTRLWSPLQELAAEQVTAPEGPVDEALARIRGAIDDAGYATLDGADGVTRVAARVIVVAARHSAHEVPGVRVALSRELSGHRDTDTEVVAGVAGASTALEITLAADYGRPLQRLAEDVRQVVTDRVRALTDLQSVEVTVIIDDVLPQR